MGPPGPSLGGVLPYMGPPGPSLGVQTPMERQPLPGLGPHGPVLPQQGGWAYSPGYTALLPGSGTAARVHPGAWSSGPWQALGLFYFTGQS